MIRINIDVTSELKEKLETAKSLGYNIEAIIKDGLDSLFLYDNIAYFINELENYQAILGSSSSKSTVQSQVSLEWNEKIRELKRKFKQEKNKPLFRKTIITKAIALRLEEIEDIEKRPLLR